MGELKRREVENIGYAGPDLEDYISKHVGFPIQHSEAAHLFAYYKELRILRNVQAHPTALPPEILALPRSRGKIRYPQSLEAFEEMLNQVRTLGQVIIQTCGLVEVSLRGRNDDKNR